MKLLIINGTPKRDGITYSFVEAAQEAAVNLGIESDVINLSGKNGENLEKCRMCGEGWGVCFGEHYCAFGEKDGFTALQKRMRDADAYVYVTPVYWGEMSEEMKIFIDKLRRCEATKKWDKREGEVSILAGKPSIIVANAGGGGGGTITAFMDIKRALVHMEGDAQPRETNGIFDMIAVNRWNQVYKRDALKAAIAEMYAYSCGKDIIPMN